jgi:hypothetical protein
VAPEAGRLREEQTRVAKTTVVEDRVELVETDDTYLELWERLSIQDRGPWLVEHGFRVTANKERVTVSQGPASATVDLSTPERMALVRDTELVHWGKCECGCGTDIHGVKRRRKRYLNGAHRTRAVRRLAPVKVEEKKYLGECECGCGTDLYGFRGGPGSGRHPAPRPALQPALSMHRPR